ncbi:MAG: type II toxin-antitoxin system VapB family antitoxin [Thermoanaerobaculia bacterium]
MKTTIELSDALLAEARRVATAEGRTVRSLVEAGLRRELRERTTVAPFRLRDASYRGKGLRRELADAPWERLRELAYEGRGA